MKATLKLMGTIESNKPSEVIHAQNTAEDPVDEQGDSGELEDDFEQK